MKSHFFDIKDKEMENVNKGGWRMGKQTKLWAKNVFDQWRMFCGYDMNKYIVDLSKNKILLKISSICYPLCFCKLQKKMVTYILQPCTSFFFFFFFSPYFLLLQKGLGFRFSLHHASFIFFLFQFF